MVSPIRPSIALFNAQATQFLETQDPADNAVAGLPVAEAVNKTATVKKLQGSNSYPIPGDPNVAAYEDVEKFAKFIEEQIASLTSKRDALLNEMNALMSEYSNLPWYVKFQPGVITALGIRMAVIQSQIPLNQDIQILTNILDDTKVLLKDHVFDHNGTKCVQLNATKNVLNPNDRMENDWPKNDWNLPYYKKPKIPLT